jgi:hypothetical protein
MIIYNHNVLANPTCVAYIYELACGTCELVSDATKPCMCGTCESAHGISELASDATEPCMCGIWSQRTCVALVGSVERWLGCLGMVWVQTTPQPSLKKCPCWAGSHKEGIGEGSPHTRLCS